MKHEHSFFIIDENGLLIINKPEIRLTKEYKDILVRDKGSVGDHEGRKKHQAFKELMYVYLYCHPSSIYRSLPDVTRSEKAKNHVGLEDKWKPDTLIKACCKRFLEDLELSPLFNSYINAERAIYATGEDIKFFNNKRDTLRRKVESDYILLDGISDDKEVMEVQKRLDRNTNTLMDLAVKITNITNSLPNAYDTLENIRKKVVKEQEDKNNVYGGGVIGNREK